MPPNASSTNKKRKLDDLLEDETYGSQRQSILNISMFKLKVEPKRRVEPSLRRNILILNTLKHIEAELEMEGVCFSTANTSALNPTFIELDLDQLPECNPNSVLHPPHASHLMPLVAMDGPPSPMPKQVVQDMENMDTCTTTISDASEKIVLDLVPCKLTSVCSPMSKTSRTPVDMLEDINNNMSPSFSTSNPSALASSWGSSSSSSSWGEDAFSDIDVSVCDVDIYSISSAMKLTPLSAEEVLHSFPSASGLASEACPSIINSQCGSSFRNEYVMDELDNIMQILVGM